MDPELRGHLEVAADETLDDIIAIATVESEVGPVSTEYVLGMLELILISELKEHVTIDEFRAMEATEEDLLREVRTLAHRRKNDVRTALNRPSEHESASNHTKVFDP